jgi:RNA polymerase sigma-70 factor (ECF subfamily)
MRYSAEDDDQLVARSREGETEAFAELISRYEDYMYNTIGHMVGFGQDAEDLCQEVFMRAYKGLGSFRGNARFKTWLYSIMLNCVRSHWRRKGRGPDVMSLDGGGDEDQSWSDPPSREDGPERKVTREETIRSVRAGIAALSENLREILVLRDLQGLSYKELAETLDLPLGTVKSRLARARDALKDELSPVLKGEL